jgi:hypothetical protein
MNTPEQTRLKENVIALVMHHKLKTCEGRECSISLFYVLQLVTMAGIELTPEERSSFI